MAQQDVPVFSVETALATASDAKDSLDGIDLALGQYESGTVAFVRVTNTYYYYDETSVAPADGVTVVAPLSGPGRWLLLSSAVAPGTCTVIRVVQDGSGDFTTIEDALAFANANATAAEPYTIVVCPGSYVPDVTLDFSNQYVSMRAAMVQTAILTAAPTVTPLINISWTIGMSPAPEQEFVGLFLSRADTGTLIETALGTMLGVVVFRDCWLYADPGLGVVGAHLQGDGNPFIDFHDCAVLGVASAPLSSDAVIRITGESRCRWFNGLMVSVGRVGNTAAVNAELDVHQCYIVSDNEITFYVDTGTLRMSDCEVFNTSPDPPSARIVVCDQATAQAYLYSSDLDGGGVETIQDNIFASAYIFMADVYMLDAPGDSITIAAGRVWAVDVVTTAPPSVGGGGMNPPELYIFGGQIPLTPGLAAVPGVRAFTSESIISGDALIAYNGDDPARQLRLDQPFTPTGTADAAGVRGDIAWDEDYIYVKTAGGWRRAPYGAVW